VDGDSQITEQTPSPIDQRKPRRRRREPRVPNHVGPRELRSLKETVTLNSPRALRNKSKLSTPEIQRASPKKSPVVKNKPPLSPIIASGARKGRRSSAHSSPIVPKKSPIISKKATITEASDEDGSEPEDDYSDLSEDDEHTGKAPTKWKGKAVAKKKRKRATKVSTVGDDADYIPEEVGRSIKKRKLEAHTHDLDHSLDDVDLGTSLEVAEENVSKDVEGITSEEEEESSEDETSSEGSVFEPSPSPEPKEKRQEKGLQQDRTLSVDRDSAEPSSATRKHASRLNRKLDPDARGYIPSPDSDESDTDGEEIPLAEILQDVRGVVKDLPDLKAKASTDAVNEQEPKKKKKKSKKVKETPAEADADSQAKPEPVHGTDEPKRKKKKTPKEAKKEHKETSKTIKSKSLPNEDTMEMDVDQGSVEQQPSAEKSARTTLGVETSGHLAHPGTDQKLAQDQTAGNTSWGLGFIRNFWNPTGRQTPTRTTPFSDQMDVD
jgi:hypothetical protein